MKNAIIYSLFLFSSVSFNAQILGKSNLQSFSGYFDFHYDASEDKIYLKVDKLEEDFLYVNSLATGVGSNDIGLDRGKLGDTRVVNFRRAGNKLLLVQPNQDYRANTDNDLERKSVEQAFAMSVIYGFPIKSETDGTFIIDITSFLMEDAQGVSAVLKANKEGNYKVDASKSALSLDRTKAFPHNVEFEALLTFTGEPTGRNLRSVTPTSSLVSVIQHHSFVKLPDDGYTPREFDTRSGAIPISYLDYATPVQESIRKRFIVRHRLEKKDPNAAISEAKEPIIYYLDPGTPEPVRSALLDGARWWNEAYEAIGFKDAFQVKILPEDADPMDCRYNVIQWVHRSTRGWSYGASVVDPRTGEIIKGHVSLGSLRIRQDFMIAQALMNKPYAENDDNYQPMLDMALARIRQLSAHEVGHTLGFTHNFASSTNDRASVMDYPHPQIALTNDVIDFSQVYDVGIGAWDKVTVAYSYSQFDPNTNEKEKLNQILEDATNKGLRFISDYDARAAGGAHALAHLWDNGTSASDQLNKVMAIRQKAMDNFSVDNIKMYEPYSVLEDVFVPLYFFHRYQTEATTKVVGGLDYNYAVKGDGQLVSKYVDKNVQVAALESLLKTLQPEVLTIPQSILDILPPRAYGYGRSRESFKSQAGVAFDPISAASTASDMTLKFLLHPERANRLVIQKGLDKNQLGLKDVLEEIIKATFENKLDGGYPQSIQHEVKVNVLKYIMNLASSNMTYFEVKAIANEALTDIAATLYDKKKSVEYANQYRKLLSEFNEHPEKFKLESAPQIPDGSPIGSDVCTYQPN